jgi:serine/threonine protein kinase
MQPENLLLDSQGNLKISDFGLSTWPAQVCIFMNLNL